MVRSSSAVLLAGLLLGFAVAALSQPETGASGSVTGVRVDGQLFEVNSRMCVVKPDWSGNLRGGGQTNYSRDGKVVTVKMQPPTPRPGAPAPPVAPLRQPPAPAFYAVESVEDTGPGTAKIDLEYTFPAAVDIAGAYLCLQLPSALYSGGVMQLVDPVAPGPAEVSLVPGTKDQNEYVHATAKGVRFIAPRRQLEVMFAEPAEVVVRDNRSQNSFDFQVYLGVLSGKAAEKQTARQTFHMKVAGEIDKAPAEIAIEASRPGRAYAGMGGDFKLQNPRTDPAVIQYNLDNMRVAWGRVEIPWRAWHPVEDVDPLAEARAGKIAPAVQQTMEMTRKLAQKGMPIVVSCWGPPTWAVVGAAEGNLRGGGGFLDPAKMDHIKKSIADYLVFMKEKYGAEAAAFAFNEWDYGPVRQTPREHAILIKTLGPYFASRGLATKLMLGDISHPYPVSLVGDAVNDPEVGKWVSVVAYHSWTGGTDANLAEWDDVARKLNVPLLITEGGLDPSAHQYPQLFLEPSFALREIELYQRILALSKPTSILHWQFTADYSLVAGGGVSYFHDDGPIRPTQRFWNVKQMGSTPPNVFYLPAKCDRPGLTCTAFGDILSGVYAVHVVNTGAARPTTITGLPAEVKQLRAWVTDGQRGMQEGERIPVAGGKAEFQLDATSFTTLISVPPAPAQQ
jgi:hypothetical protein